MGFLSKFIEPNEPEPAAKSPTTRRPTSPSKARAAARPATPAGKRPAVGRTPAPSTNGSPSGPPTEVFVAKRWATRFTAPFIISISLSFMFNGAGWQMIAPMLFGILIGTRNPWKVTARDDVIRLEFSIRTPVVFRKDAVTIWIQGSRRALMYPGERPRLFRHYQLPLAPGRTKLAEVLGEHGYSVVSSAKKR